MSFRLYLFICWECTDQHIFTFQFITIGNLLFHLNYANYAMQNADVIISLGARFDDRVTGNLKRMLELCFFE